MRKQLFIITVVFFLPFSTAFSFFDVPPPEKIVNPELICEDDGVKIAFNIKERRIWTSDRGLDEGVELAVQSFVKNDSEKMTLSVEAIMTFLGESATLYYDTVEPSDKTVMSIAYFEPEIGKKVTVQEDIPCYKVTE